MMKNKKRGGSIINMSSQLGHVGMAGRNVYNMTKFGIEGLTKGMGVELAKNNIRVNTVAPTFVATPMVKKFFKNKEFKKLALGNIPMGKLATESDVATSVCFLASSASSMVTATSILVDGGWTAKVIYRLLLLVALFFSTQSFALEFQGKFIQGHFIIGKTDPGSSIFVDKKKVKVSKDGYFAFGIEKDRKFDITITENGNKIIKKIKKENTIFKKLMDYLKKKLHHLKSFT